MSDWSPGTFLGPATIVDLVRRRAKHHPDKGAYAFLSDGEIEECELTFADVDRKARAIGAQLQALGLAGERALLLFPPGMDFITAFYGCLYGGVVAVTAYPPRMNRSLGRINSIVADAEARIALTTRGVYNRILPSVEQDPELDRLQWLTTDEVDEQAADEWRQPDIDSETLAFLQYTSGSTGTPKGVMLTHGNLLHNSALICYGFDHAFGSCGVFWLPNYHDMGLVGGIIQPMYLGRLNVLMSPMAFLQKPLRWLQAISRYRATTSGGPNFAYDLCVRKISPEQREQLDLSSWRVAFNGAEPVRQETIREFTRAFASCGFRPEAFYPCYGLAEASLIVTGGRANERPVSRSFDGRILDLGEAIQAPVGEPTARSLIGCGQAMPDLDVAIVDPQSRRPVGPGQVGEIWVSGPSIAQGYWRRDEETRLTFQAQLARDEAQGTGVRYLRTGDLGFVDEGELFVTGRIKDLIIIRGTNHYPQDIELTMEHSHPALRPHTAAAFALDIPGGSRLIVIQEIERRRHDEAPAIIAAIRRNVSREHQVQVDGVVLVKAGSIPKTSSGKIQRFACRDEYLKGSLQVIQQWQLGDEMGESMHPAAGVELRTAAVDKDSVVLRESELATADSRGSSSIERAHGSSSLEVRRVEPRGGESAPRSNGAHTAGSHSNGNGHGPAQLRRHAPHVANSNGVTGNGHRDEYEPDRKPRGEKQPLSHGKPAAAAGQIDRNQMIEDLYRLVRETAGERVVQVNLDSTLSDLGFDSLARIELQASIEEHFGGRMPEEVGPQLESMRDIISAIETYLGQTSGSGVAGQVDPEQYCFEQFAETKKLRESLALIDDSGLVNPYFRVHQRGTADTTLIDGRELINFSSFNYIGMSGDPVVNAAAKAAIDRYGSSVSASRLVSGEKALHCELEQKLVELHGTEAAIVYVAGHATNVNTIGHLYSTPDLVLYDALAHNSIQQGAKLSGARRRAVPHNDWRALDRLLSDVRHKYRRVLVAIEAVYSMDGDIADLPRYVEVRNRHKVNLLVDEAHSIGVIGATGRGAAEHFGLCANDVDLWMGTLSKGLGSCGGYIAANKAVIEYLKYTSPGFVFATGIAPSNAAAALAAIEVLEGDPQRVAILHERSRLFLELARQAGLNTGMSHGTPIIPIIMGNSLDSLRLSQAMLERGINVQPILHPAVDEKASRLRFFLTCNHTEEQVRYTVAALAEEAERIDPKYVAHKGAAVSLMASS